MADVDSFFFATSFLVVGLGSAYSYFHSRAKEDEEWFAATKTALEVVIITLLVGSTSVGILYICRGYQKHGWVHARVAGTQVKRELTRRLRRGKIAVLHHTASLRKSSGRGDGSMAGASMAGEEVVAKPTNVEIEVSGGVSTVSQAGRDTDSATGGASGRAQASRSQSSSTRSPTPRPNTIWSNWSTGDGLDEYEGGGSTLSSSSEREADVPVEGTRPAGLVTLI